MVSSRSTPPPPPPPPSPPLLDSSSSSDVEELLFPFSSSAGGLGLRIVGGRGESDHPSLPPTPIYVWRLSPEGVAARDGRLRRGDILLGVNHARFGDVTADFARDALKAACGVAAAAMEGGMTGKDEGQVRLLVRHRSPETDHVFHSILAMRERGAASSSAGGGEDDASIATPQDGAVVSNNSLRDFDDDDDEEWEDEEEVVVDDEEEEEEEGGHFDDEISSLIDDAFKLPPPPPIPNGSVRGKKDKGGGGGGRRGGRGGRRGGGVVVKEMDGEIELRSDLRRHPFVPDARRASLNRHRRESSSNRDDGGWRRESTGYSGRRRRPSSGRGAGRTSPSPASASASVGADDDDDLSRFHFSPSSIVKNNPIFHDSSQTIVPAPREASFPHPSSSSSSSSSLGSVPLDKIVDSLRRLGFAVTAAESRALTKELEAAGGFVDDDRVLVDARKCFRAAKRVFRGGGGGDDDGGVESVRRTSKEKDDRRKSTSFEKSSSNGNSMSGSGLPRTRGSFRGDRNETTRGNRDGRDHDHDHEESNRRSAPAARSSSSSNDVTVMSKLLAESRRERDSARLEGANWMLRAEEFKKALGTWQKEAKDAKVVAAVAQVENAQLKKELEKTRKELKEVKSRDSSNRVRIESLSKESSEAKALLEARKEHPEVAKKLAILKCELKKWKRWSNIQDVAGHRMLSFLEKTHADLMRNKEEGRTKNTLRAFHSRRSAAENGEPPNYLASLSSAAPSFQTIASKCRQLYLSVKSLLEEEEPLPYGWERTLSPNGNAAYFVDHNRGKSSWTHPVTGESSYAGEGGGGGGDDDDDDGNVSGSPPFDEELNDNEPNEFPRLADDDDDVGGGVPPVTGVASPSSLDGDWGDEDDGDDISRVVEDRSFPTISVL